MDLARLAGDVRAAEGFSLTAYKDSLGLWTAGYGHLLDQRNDWTGHTFDPQTVDEWLIADLATALHGAEQLLEWASLDTSARQNAVAELVFNLGIGHWRGFAHSRMFMTKKNWPQAAAELLDSTWAKQVGPRRSGRIATYIESGEFS